MCCNCSPLRCLLLEEEKRWAAWQKANLGDNLCLQTPVCSQVSSALYERQVTTFIPLEQARCYQRTHIRSTQAFLIKFMITLSFCVDTAVQGAAPAEPDVTGIAACLKSSRCSFSLSCRHNFF